MKSVIKSAINNLKGGAAVLARPTVDFPVQDELIVSSEYTFRVSAPENAESVEVSINQGPWLACRKAEGFWWYDWSGFDNGEHELIARTLVARMPGKSGKFLLSTPVEFKVKRPS